MLYLKIIAIPCFVLSNHVFRASAVPMDLNVHPEHLPYILNSRTSHNKSVCDGGLNLKLIKHLTAWLLIHSQFLALLGLRKWLWYRAPLFGSRVSRSWNWLGTNQTGSNWHVLRTRRFRLCKTTTRRNYTHVWANKSSNFPLCWS